MLPVLYSFRRCPYAMRARLAIASSGVQVVLREILLRDKAPEFLEASPSTTVPCLKAGDLIIDESYDIMLWALGRNDPEGWTDMPAEGASLIEYADGPFKSALDHYKYASRHPEVDVAKQRELAAAFLMTLDKILDQNTALFGDTVTLADMAILPFVRQFAFVDKDWFDQQPWPNVSRWLEQFITSSRFLNIMHKYPVWHSGETPTVFPAA